MDIPIVIEDSRDMLTIPGRSTRVVERMPGRRVRVAQCCVPAFAAWVAAQQEQYRTVIRQTGRGMTKAQRAVLAGRKVWARHSLAALTSLMASMLCTQDATAYEAACAEWDAACDVVVPTATAPAVRTRK